MINVGATISRPKLTDFKKDFIRGNSLKLYSNPSAKGGHLNHSSFIFHYSSITIHPSSFIIHPKSGDKMEKILIIEDDTYINNLVSDALGKSGYSTVQAFSGTEGLLYAKTEELALIIMDLMLPGIEGEALLPKLKEISPVPVIVLSAKDSLDSKIGLLNSGAEDYITKPFDIGELIARAGVQIRRFSGETAKPKLLRHKGLSLSLSDMTAEIDGVSLTLTKQEFKILELLLENQNRVFTKQDIYSYAWDDIYIGEDKTVNVHISNIRKKLKAVSEEEYIETVWGIGFRLKK